MSVSRTLTVCVLGVGFGIAVLVVGGGAWLNHSLNEDLRHQAELNAAAKPRLEAVVTKKLKIGDSLEHAQEVLRTAGLSFSVDKNLGSKPRLYSIYRTGQGCGFSIHLELDTSDKISNIDIREFFTGL